MPDRSGPEGLVSRVVRELPALPRLAFMLRYADRMSITDTAKILGIRREEAFEHLWAARRAAKDARRL